MVSFALEEIIVTSGEDGWLGATKAAGRPVNRTLLKSERGWAFEHRREEKARACLGGKTIRPGNRLNVGREGASDVTVMLGFSGLCH